MGVVVNGNAQHTDSFCNAITSNAATGELASSLQPSMQTSREDTVNRAEQGRSLEGSKRGHKTQTGWLRSFIR